MTTATRTTLADVVRVTAAVLKAAGAAPVASVADLRERLGDPACFDAVVLQLARDRAIVPFCDVIPGGRGSEGAVPDGDGCLTCFALAR